MGRRADWGQEEDDIGSSGICHYPNPVPDFTPMNQVYTDLLLQVQVDLMRHCRLTLGQGNKCLEDVSEGRQSPIGFSNVQLSESCRELRRTGLKYHNSEQTL